MKKIALILTTAILASCGGGKKTAEDIRKEISTCKDKIATLNGNLKELETELAKLDTTKGNTTAGKPVTISVAKVEAFNHFIEVQGKLDGDKNVNVYPEAPGMLTDILVKIGDQVSEGQVIARINDASAREQLKALESQLQLSTEIYEKQKALWEQNIGSEVQYLQSKTTKEALEAQVAGVKKQLDMMRIKSPVSGTIESLPIKIGQMVAPQMPVCNVVSFGALKAVAEIAEAYTANVKEGDGVIVYIPDLKKEINARVDFCSKYISPVNRTFSVEAHFTGNNEMKANMVVVLKINDYRAPNAIVLPINLIQNDNDKQFVFVGSEENGIVVARKKFVSTGKSYNGLAEITSGLQKGDTYISSGFLSIEDGEQIQVQ